MNSGQVCLCLKRLYIHESIYEQFRDALVKQASGVKVGNGFDEGVTHGPIQNSMQYERVKGFFAEIEKQGQKVAVGGKNEHGSKGYFITPTIIDNPPDDSRIVVEEPFGKLVFRVVKTTQAAPSMSHLLTVTSQPQVLSCPFSPGRRRTKLSRVPTTRRWAWVHQCGPQMSKQPRGSRDSSRPEMCGLTRISICHQHNHLEVPRRVEWASNGVCRE
jgi:hypothetical protein